MNHRRMTPVAAAAVVALGLSGCSGGTELTAQLGEVGTATVVEVVEAPANVVAAASATVTATATGTIGSLLVTDGANVRKGRLLFVIDSPDTDRALATARAAVANAPRPVDLPGIDTSASSEQASTAADQAFGRAREAARQIPNRQLRRQALQQVTAAKAQFDSAQAQATATASQLNQAIAGLEQALGSLTRVQLTQAQAGLTAARQAKADLRVRAPISGRVVLAAGAGDGVSTSSLSGLVDQLPDSVSGQAESLLGGGASGGSTTGTLQTGSPVTAGDPLLAITDVSSLSLRAEVDETDVLLVRKGVKADVELDAVPGASYRAVVRNVDLAPTTSARGGVTYVVRLDLRGGTAPDGAPAPRPRPGMSAIASLRVAVAEDALAVPVSAVFRDEDEDAVWFVDNGVAEVRAVTIGAQGESFLQVIDGLQLGDPIVTSGADLVTDGDELP